MVIELNNRERSLAWTMANKRAEYGTANDWNEQDDPKRKYQTILYVGLLGEIAFCKKANLYPEIGDEDMGRGHDGVLPDGRTFDVKTVAPDRRLVVHKKKPGKEYADIFILMHCDMETGDVWFVGWLEQEKVITQAALDYGATMMRNPGYTVDVEYLHREMP